MNTTEHLINRAAGIAMDYASSRGYPMPTSAQVSEIAARAGEAIDRMVAWLDAINAELPVPEKLTPDIAGHFLLGVAVEAIEQVLGPPQRRM